jgi:hypothetical protein
MAGELSLSRNAKLYVTTAKLGEATTQANIGTVVDASNCWQIPILDGFSFTQEPTVQEIGVSEAGATPVRGQQVFNTALEPANWSFSTYMRPRLVEGSVAGDFRADAVERILWEAFGSPTTSPITTQISGSATTLGQNAVAATAATAGMKFDLTASQTNQLLTVSLIFELGDSFFILYDAVVDTAELDFAIDAIATINWTGFANGIKRIDKPATWVGVALDHEAVDFDEDGQYVALPAGDLACIRNKLSVLRVKDNSGASGWNGGVASTNIALTGGSLTISNNIEYLTPEALGVLNKPCGHLTGTRTVNGSITAYLKLGPAYTAGLLEYLSQATSADPYDFEIDIFVGGGEAARPTIWVNMPHTHLGIPNPQIEDVIQVEITFNALPHNGTNYDFGSNNEVEVVYRPSV